MLRQADVKKGVIMQREINAANGHEFRDHAARDHATRDQCGEGDSYFVISQHMIMQHDVRTLFPAQPRTIPARPADHVAALAFRFWSSHLPRLEPMQQSISRR